MGVWWPLEHRTFKGVVTSLHGNLARFQYDDGDVGEAMILDGGQIVQAETYDERTEDPGQKKPKRCNEPRASSSTEPAKKRGRSVGSKDAKPRSHARDYGKRLVPIEELPKKGREAE